MPSIDRYAAWKACMDDFGGSIEELHGTGHWFLPQQLQLDTEPDTFAALVGILLRLRRELPEGPLVPSETYWVFDGEEMVGFLQLRLRLTEQLLETGGHIGYSIRPSRRRAGHAGRALALALERCREVGIDRVLISCLEGNLGSEGTIRANGGVYEDTREGLRRFWIDLAD